MKNEKAFTAWLQRRTRIRPETTAIRAVTGSPDKIILNTVDVNGPDIEVAGVELVESVNDNEFIVEALNAEQVLASFPIKRGKTKEEKERKKDSRSATDAAFKEMVKLVGGTFENVKDHNQSNFAHTFKLLERDDTEVQRLRAELGEMQQKNLDLFRLYVEAKTENTLAIGRRTAEDEENAAQASFFRDMLGNIVKEGMPHLPQILAALGIGMGVKEVLSSEKPAEKPTEKSGSTIARVQLLRDTISKLPDECVDNAVMALCEVPNGLKAVGQILSKNMTDVDFKKLVNAYVEIEVTEK